jgi:hypothetical protein
MLPHSKGRVAVVLFQYAESVSRPILAAAPDCAGIDITLRRISFRVLLAGEVDRNNSVAAVLAGVAWKPRSLVGERMGICGYAAGLRAPRPHRHVVCGRPALPARPPSARLASCKRMALRNADRAAISYAEHTVLDGRLSHGSGRARASVPRRNPGGQYPRGARADIRTEHNA